MTRYESSLVAAITLRYNSEVAAVMVNQRTRWLADEKERSIVSCPLVYIVDDDEDLREGMMAFFRSAGYATTSFTDAEAFLAFGHPRNVDCLISDLKLPGMSGLDLKAELVKQECDCLVILMTDYATLAVFLQARSLGFCYVVEKPFDMEFLLLQIDELRNARQRSTFC
jgi:FixJ family two-component response regulator